MSLIIDLPCDVCNEVLLHWLGFRDICKIDSAMMNTKTRKGFLAFLSSLSGLSFKFVACNAAYDWFYCRSIKLISLDINSFCFHNGNLAFRVNFLLVRDIHLSYFETEMDSLMRMAQVVNMCTFLQSINCDYNFICLLDKNILANIVHLSVLLSRHTQITRELEYLKSICTKLQTISFYSGVCESVAFLDLLILNPSLKSVNVSFRRIDVLGIIERYCRYLDDINLSSNNISLVQVSKLLLDRPFVKRLSIKTDGKIVEYKIGEKGKEVYLNGFKQDEIAEFVQRTQNISVLELMGSKYEATLEGLLTYSCQTLTALRVGKCGTMDFSKLSLLKTTCPHLTQLEFSYDGGPDIFDFFALGGENSLTHLKLFGPQKHVDLTLIPRILVACPRLMSLQVMFVQLNIAFISELKEFVYRRYGETKLMVDIHFPPIPEDGCTRRLRFMDGRFSGEGMEKYLTKEERLRKPMILVKK